MASSWISLFAPSDSRKFRLTDMVDKTDFEFPVDIHIQDRPVTLVDQFIGSDTPLMEQVRKKRFGTVKVPFPATGPGAR